MADAGIGAGIEAAFAAAYAGDVAGAIRRYRALIAASPRDPALHNSLGQLLLLTGDFAAGWEECEWRPQRAIDLPRWRGAPLNGAGILIHGEQGFGDNFHFVRYAALVAERGGRAIVATREGLRPLLATVPGVSAVIEPGDMIQGAAWQIPMLSLPYVFGTTLASIPARVPYLAADAARIDAWRGRLASYPGLRIGLVWSGQTDAPYNWRRSPGLATLAPLLDGSSATFFALQMGGGREQLKDAVPSPNFVDLGPELASFGETAAAMMALDLVITPCTSTAHLAGALGRPLWVMLSSFPDWRWLLGRDTSPWYPTARLFRQARPGDWNEPVTRMRAELERMAAPSPQPSPASGRGC